MATKVTVVILSRNRLKLLTECLKSILAQKSNDYNILVSENSETNIIYDYIKQHFVDVKLIKRANLSAEEHFNAVISECQTEFLVIFHDDDVMYPEYIDHMLKILVNNDDYSAVACNAFINRNNRRTYQNFFYHSSVCIKSQKDLIQTYCKFGFSKPAPFPGYMYRVESLKKLIIKSKVAGKYTDVVMLLELLKKGKIFWLSDRLMEYRIHPNNDSGVECISDRKKLVNYFSNILSDTDQLNMLNKYRLKYLIRIKLLKILRGPKRKFAEIFRNRHSLGVLIYHLIKCGLMNLRGLFIR
jgi:glycosyltransferase involved in cell wall biosynthesis